MATDFSEKKTSSVVGIVQEEAKGESDERVFVHPLLGRVACVVHHRKCHLEGFLLLWSPRACWFGQAKLLALSHHCILAPKEV